MEFEGRVIIRDLSCEMARGKISVVLGGSGSGKTTLLRLMAGLLEPTAGRILVDGEDITRLSETRRAAVRRKIGMMFQAGALLDSMTVFENVALPLREHSSMSRLHVTEVVDDRLREVDLLDIEDLGPKQISGGMVKRAALARAIIEGPPILLCDEPFSGLDPVSTRRIEALLIALNQRHGMTMVIVSHHVRSTLRMADRILLLLPDAIVVGTPRELLQSTDPRVVSFLDEDRPFEGRAPEVERLPVLAPRSKARRR